MKTKKHSDKLTREDLREGMDPLEQLSEQTDLNHVARKIATQYRDNTISPNVVAGALRVIDVILAFSAGICAYIYYISFFEIRVFQYTGIAVLGAFLIMAGFEFFWSLSNALFAHAHSFCISCCRHLGRWVNAFYSHILFSQGER